MKILTRLFTKNLTKIPLLWITFNWKLFKKNGAKGSCMCNIHPCLKDDEHIKTTMEELCDYIRENYDKIIKLNIIFYEVREDEIERNF